MSIFVDTGVFVSFANKRDKNHDRAVELFDELRSSKHGMVYTSDYVFDESVTTALVRTRRVEVAVKTGFLILGSKEPKIPPVARMLRVDERTFQEAWKTFYSRTMPGLSFTDHTSVSLSRSYAGAAIMSFDEDFDALLTRIG